MMLSPYLGGQVQLVHIVVDLCQDVLQAQTLQSFQLVHLAGGETNSIYNTFLQQNCIDTNSTVLLLVGCGEVFIKSPVCDVCNIRSKGVPCTQLGLYPIFKQMQ